MTLGISSPFGISQANTISPTSDFSAPFNLLGAIAAAAAETHSTRRKRKEEQDMREPNYIELDAEYHLEPITGTAPPARTHQK